MEVTPKPSKEETLSQALAVASPTEMDSMLRFAKALADGNLLPRSYQKNPANILWAMEYARTLNITPIAAMAGVHVIDGKPSASSALISALVRRAGHKLRVTFKDGTATATIVRADDPDFTFISEWTIDRAKIAGLTGKQVWKNYPDAMLKARAITEAARDACQEALFGLLYTPEELGATVDGDGNPIVSSQGEVVMGEVEDPVEDMAVLPEMIEGWAKALIEKPVMDLIPVGMDINRFHAMELRTNVAGEPSLRELLVQRIGDALVDAEVKAQAKDVWSLIKGFGLDKETFTYTDGSEDVTVLLGEFCIARGKALPEEAPVQAPFEGELSTIREAGFDLALVGEVVEGV
jgi:hypothetical protein